MQDTNLNLAQCIVTKTHFGYDTVINICSGKTQEITWAFGDWALAAVVTVVCLMLLATLAGLLLMMVSDY